MNNKKSYSYDKELAWSYYEPDTKVFKFPCPGRYHEFDLSKVLYIGTIESDISIWDIRSRSKFSGRYWFNIALKDVGLITINIKNNEEFYEIDHYIYDIHRGMIIIWKELLNAIQSDEIVKNELR